MRIAVCATQIPFARGGAEVLAASLRDELLRRGFAAELVTVPFAWEPRAQLLKSALAWRLLDLATLDGEPVDLVIATRFPSYLIRHPNKVVWLVHQFRQVYDLLGTPYSDFGSRPEDREVVRRVREMDRRALAEARSVFAISANTAARLSRFNGLAARPVHVPPPLAGVLRPGGFGDYVLAVGRLDPLKRVELLIEAIARAGAPVRAIVAGEGPERAALGQRAERLGVSHRVEFRGRIGEADLVELYAGALAVFYAPFDEDYGYVTVEAMMAGKPVVTAADAGGVLEFVADGETGLVAPAAEPAAVARAVDRLAGDRALAARLGEEGRRRVAGIGWDQVIEALTGRQP